MSTLKKSFFIEIDHMKVFLEVILSCSLVQLVACTTDLNVSSVAMNIFLLYTILCITDRYINELFYSGSTFYLLNLPLQ